ncbi:hypothetical protein J4441_01515 [Candidatus Micrarchaeota archaeon]|nr:hypothetical protein [Candidatus Micrarchaeota archaeon]
MRKTCDFCGTHKFLTWHEELQMRYCPKCKPEMEKKLKYEKQWGSLRPRL